MNELQYWGEAEADDWYAMGLDQLEETVVDIRVEHGRANEVLIGCTTLSSAPGFKAGYHNTYRYTVSADGSIRIDYEGTPFGAMLTRWLPRFGLQMRLSEKLDQFQWYGRGPMETYPDRKSGARIGVYNSPVAEQYIPYVVPQDQGNRTDVRWASLTDSDGMGLRVTADSLINVSTTFFSNFDRAQYPFQLQKAGAVILNIDHRVTGVGGTPVPVRPAYRTYPQPYHFSITLEPIFKPDEAMHPN